jgi:hypothetical protein
MVLLGAPYGLGLGYYGGYGGYGLGYGLGYGYGLAGYPVARLYW